MSNDDNQYDELYKVVLVGDAGVGKTNMLANFTGTKSGDVCNESGCADTFHPMRKPTIGVEFGTRIVTHTSGIKIKAQIWDTAGQERYRAITSSHYRRAAGALLVYDVSSKKTYDHAKELWLKELCDSADEESGLLSCVMLVGNKIDLEQEGVAGGTFVSKEEHERDAQSLGLLSARTSAKSGFCVEKAFNELIIRIYDQDRQKQQQCKNNAVKHDNIQMNSGARGKKEDKPCC